MSVFIECNFSSRLWEQCDIRCEKSDRVLNVKRFSCACNAKGERKEVKLRPERGRKRNKRSFGTFRWPPIQRESHLSRQRANDSPVSGLTTYGMGTRC
jgi:hypothetical protein